MAKKFHIKFKDKTSQQWFKTAEFQDKKEMLDHYWSKVRGSACEVEFHGPNGKITEGVSIMSATEIVEFALADNAVSLKETVENMLKDKTNSIIESLRPEVNGELFGATKVVEESSDENTPSE